MVRGKGGCLPLFPPMMSRSSGGYMQSMWKRHAHHSWSKEGVHCSFSQEITKRFQTHPRHSLKYFSQQRERASFLFLEDFVFVETVVEDEVGESVVKMGPEADNAVVLVRVRQLLEEDVGLLQSTGQHHTLLVMHIVV